MNLKNEPNTIFQYINLFTLHKMQNNHLILNGGVNFCQILMDMSKLHKSKDLSIILFVDNLGITRN